MCHCFSSFSYKLFLSVTLLFKLLLMAECHILLTYLILMMGVASRLVVMSVIDDDAERT